MDKAHLTADALCDFAEGLMPPGDRREAEAHLAGCADCRREAAAMQGYFREMSGLETLRAPDRFLTRVHARIAKSSPWRRLLAALSSPRLLPVPLMGLAVLLVGVYFVFLSPRLAEQALADNRPAPAAPAMAASETTVQFARKQKAAAADGSPQAGAFAEAPAEPPAQVAMAPARPASGAEKRLPLASRSKRADQDARKAAPARSKPLLAASEDSPGESEALALAEGSAPAKGRREMKQETLDAAGSAGSKERTFSDERSTEGGRTDPSAVYLIGNDAPPGREAIINQLAERPGQADLLKDAPSGPPAAAPAAKAEAAPADKASSPEAASAARLSEPLAVAAGGSHGRASAAPSPPAVTPKPWAPLGYTLKSGIGEASLRGGLARLGVKVLRQEEDQGHSFELEVPATRIMDLEAYLGGLGSLKPSPQSLPGGKNGSPIRLTLRVTAP